MVTVQDTKTYQSFYTKSPPIVEYMVEQLQCSSNDSVLEPCGGDGAFIDAILAKHHVRRFDICELEKSAYETLCYKYASLPHIEIRNCDTLLDEELTIKSRIGEKYDKIIGNPPYGAWMDYAKRSFLKKIYPGLYVKETYSLFLYRCIELLKNEGILSFIIPDTFLNLHLHQSLRHHILKKTQILELALFPSSFFPDVNFGYANLSIITLKKCNQPDLCFNNVFRVLHGFNSVHQLNTKYRGGVKNLNYVQGEILANPGQAFFISDDRKVVEIIIDSPLKIGDVADCVTGFYSGNDKRFLRVANHSLRNGKKYDMIDKNQIFDQPHPDRNILNGIDGSKCFVPIVKGGNMKYQKPDDWFMDWSRQSVLHYINDKKARFQNSQYYFQNGIAVPMISSSSITASLLKNRLFDQSIVGVFPKDQSLINCLLAFFNSSICNKLIRIINPSTNNPANYIKKIPFVYPTPLMLEKINGIVNSILASIAKDGSYNRDFDLEINNIFDQIYS